MQLKINTTKIVREIEIKEFKIPYYGFIHGSRQTSAISIELDMVEQQSLKDYLKIVQKNKPETTLEDLIKEQSYFIVVTAQTGFGVKSMVKKERMRASDSIEFPKTFPQLYIDFENEITKEEFEAFKQLALNDINS